jgi:hypothetical protein
MKSKAEDPNAHVVIVEAERSHDVAAEQENAFLPSTNKSKNIGKDSIGT